MAKPRAQPLFVLGDLDGFFGLAIDNLIQFLLILGLGGAVLGFPPELILGRILPGAALSIVVGNIFYALEAQKLSRRTGRTDVTALPYGINTPSLFAFIFLVMLPIKGAAEQDGATPERAAEIAWQVGLAACLASGLIELGGSTVGAWVRRVTPRAALLSTLAGIAISFIAIDFALRTFDAPLVAILPLGVILAAYFAHARLPLGLPGGLVAVALGTVAAWVQWSFDPSGSPIDGTAIDRGVSAIGLYVPWPVLGDLWAGLTHPLFGQFFLPVILPMGLFNALGSLQNIESAEAAGDVYPTAPSMVMNGLGSVVAAGFGSCFPTTIYIGHPGWKALGARTGYSIANAAFFVALATFGLGGLVAAVVPLEAGIAIVLYIGLVITAQAFQATPRAHAPAVAVGLFPGIAAWGVLLVTQTLGAAAQVVGDFGLPGRVLEAPGAFERAGLQLEGLAALSQGFLLTCMVWSASAALLIDRKFEPAAMWMGVGCALSFFGFIHAGRIGPSGGEMALGVGTGWPWAVGYLLTGAFFLLLRKGARRDHPRG